MNKELIFSVEVLMVKKPDRIIIYFLASIQFKDKSNDFQGNLQLRGIKFDFDLHVYGL